MSNERRPARQDQRLSGPDQWHGAPCTTAQPAPIIEAPCALPHPAAPVARARHAGFTLIELMIGIAVAGLLSTVALPSFEAQLQRARRSDALVAMMQIQAAQERFRSNGTSYGTLAQIGVAETSAARHYRLQTGAVTADGYEVTAIATGAQARDTGCAQLKLVSTGMNVSHASGPDATVSNPDTANRRCWSL